MEWGVYVEMLVNQGLVLFMVLFKSLLIDQLEDMFVVISIGFGLGYLHHKYYVLEVPLRKGWWVKEMLKLQSRSTLNETSI